MRSLHQSDFRPGALPLNHCGSIAFVRQVSLFFPLAVLLSVCLSVCLPFLLSVCLFVFLSLLQSIGLSLGRSDDMALCHMLNQSGCQCVSASVCQCVSVPLCPSDSMSVCQCVRVSDWHSKQRASRRSVFLSFCWLPPPRWSEPSPKALGTLCRLMGAGSGKPVALFPDASRTGPRAGYRQQLSCYHYSRGGEKRLTGV